MPYNSNFFLSFDSIDGITRCVHLGRTKHDVTEGLDA